MSQNDFHRPDPHELHRLQEKYDTEKQLLRSITKTMFMTGLTCSLFYLAGWFSLAVLAWCLSTIAMFKLGMRAGSLSASSAIIAVALHLTLALSIFAGAYRHHGLIVVPAGDYPAIVDDAGAARTEPIVLNERVLEELAVENGWTESEQGKASYQLWSDSLYFSVVTWTTVGYGDIQPSSGAQPYAATEALAGYISMGVWLALIAQFMSKIDAEEHRLN